MTDPTWGASRKSACSAMGMPCSCCRPLSVPPMRLPRPPARMRPVICSLSIMGTSIDARRRLRRLLPERGFPRGCDCGYTGIVAVFSMLYRTEAFMVAADSILNALQSVVDPNTGKDFVSTKSVKNLAVKGGDVSFDIELGYPAKSQIPVFKREL